MNIKEAKEQIKNAMNVYLAKDEFGNYRIPVEHQRNAFLLGPPGIGKTAIMAQIAQELNVGLVSYSMTHHTRQSALGLPYILEKNYGGRQYRISEYTMSEIIATVYDLMEETGLKEGILFLDEINCVSETLAPAMLQFLQFKTFGRHRVPEGWIVVTAGNPPEYNRSVREFDIVTWDRLKRIDVEPDFTVWKEYAVNAGVHPAVTTYLDIRKDDFYKVKTTERGKQFVTARGWDDLSEMIYLYEEHRLPVNEKLIAQYLQDPAVAKEFAVYYDLFRKYQSDYQVDAILAGTESEEIRNRAANARFDERLSLLGMLLDKIIAELRNVVEQDNALREAQALLLEIREQDAPLAEQLAAAAEQQRAQLAVQEKANTLSPERLALRQRVLALLAEQQELLQQAGEPDFAVLRDDFNRRVDRLREQAKIAGERLSQIFHFTETAFRDGREMLILVTNLTDNSFSAQFISRFGCPEYFAHNKDLLFYERQQEIANAIRQLENL